MEKLIRKISIGKDYKNDAMHYAVGQEVYGGHTICDILEEDDKFSVYIKKNKDVLPWNCLLYTSPSPRDPKTSRMPSSA